ncbi:MAG: hypothetical protein ACR2OG_09365 [Gemmatimonadaceae bacterium]
MDFLVLLEERPEHSAVLARVDSVPASPDQDQGARDVVTLYGTPSSESLALALAAAMESRRTAGGDLGTFRHLGLWPERGALGDAAWRDRSTGELMTRDVNIPLDVLTTKANALMAVCGGRLQRLVAGLMMPDWPEGAWRAIGLTLEPMIEPTRSVLGKLDDLLDNLRVADGLTYEYEGD